MNGGMDKTIKLWDPSINTNIHTLLFDLKDYSIVTQLQGHSGAVGALSIYDIDSNP